jgi:hypothetical protein
VPWSDAHFGERRIGPAPWMPSSGDPTLSPILSGGHKSILTEGDLIDFAINQSFDFE